MQPYGPDDYASQLAQLLPQGEAWRQGQDGVLAGLLRALAEEPARLDAAAHELLAELCPALTVALLPRWEDVCGLPDQCSQPNETLAERREAVVAKLAALGGQTPEYFAELATLLCGAVCTVREYRACRVGMSSIGDPVGDAWAGAWTVRGPSRSIRSAAAGTASIGDPLRSWGHERMECIIRRLAPAHTNVTFAYGRTLGDWESLGSVEHIGD